MATTKKPAAAVVADGMVENTLGRAVLALVDAGKPVSVKTLIACLLAEPSRTGVPREWKLAAAKRLQRQPA